MEILHGRHLQQEVDHIYRIHGIVPFLHLLLGDKPQLHVVQDGILLVLLPNGLHGSHLGRDAVIHPRVVGCICGVETSLTRPFNGVFLQEINQLVRRLHMVESPQRVSRIGYAINGQVAMSLLHPRQIHLTHLLDLFAHRPFWHLRRHKQIA